MLCKLRSQPTKTRISGVQFCASNMSEKVVTEDDDVPNLEIRESFYFPPDFDNIKLMIEWVSKQQGIICDLDVNMYCYDERVS